MPHRETRRRSLTVLFVTLIACACAWAIACSGKGSTAPSAAPPATPAAPAAPTTIRLSGTVVNQVSGQSIANATVSVLDGPNAGKTATSDAAGSFGLDLQPASPSSVQVSASSYNTFTASIDLRVEARLVAMLQRSSRAISGVATDYTSRGVLPNVQISSEGLPATRTDSAGRYTLTGASTGYVTVFGSANGYTSGFAVVPPGGDAVADLVLTRFGAVPPPPTPAPSAPKPPSGGVVFGFDGLKGALPYSESGFTVEPFAPFGGAPYSGNPTPSVAFAVAPGTTLSGQVRVRAAAEFLAPGGPFRFQSVDLYSISAVVPYVISGWLGTQRLFVLAGESRGLSGAFVTIQNPNQAVTIDALDIELRNTASACCSNTMAIDNIILIR